MNTLHLVTLSFLLGITQAHAKTIDFSTFSDAMENAADAFPEDNDECSLVVKSTEGGLHLSLKGDDKKTKSLTVSDDAVIKTSEKQGITYSISNQYKITVIFADDAFDSIEIKDLSKDDVTQCEIDF